MRWQKYSHHHIGFQVVNNQFLICLRIKVPIQVYSTWSGSLHDENQYLLFSLKKTHFHVFTVCLNLFQLYELLSIKKFDKKNTHRRTENIILYFTTLQRKRTMLVPIFFCSSLGIDKNKTERAAEIYTWNILWLHHMCIAVVNCKRTCVAKPKPIY